MEAEIIARLRAYIIDRHLPGESPANLKDDTPLQSSGILDSLAVLELASFVQSEFDVTLTASETTAESFDRLSDIARTIARHATTAGALRKAS